MSNIVVYGRGKTGQSLAKLAKKQGHNVVFYDDEHGFSTEYHFERQATVLVSPGVKPNAKGLLEAKKVQANVVSELEYCFPLCKGKCISVTGTNGKTTTCEMIEHILKLYGAGTYLLGNGGIPFSSKVDEVVEGDIVVLESSSFQLFNCKSFSPYVSVFTNFAPDHLDYHSNLDEYAQAKMNNFIWQKDGYAIFNFDDAAVMEMSCVSKTNKLTYSVNDARANCYFDDAVRVCVGGHSVSVNSQYFASLSSPNLSNALAAVLACYCVGVSVEFSVSALASYVFLPHRLQTVRTIDNVIFVDDSKATNVHAACSALGCFSQNIALIVGGSDKGEQYDCLFVPRRENLVKVVATGDTAERIAICGREHGVEVDIVDDIKTAVSLCYDVLKNGTGVVLMSNACASFDRFKGYDERGDYFQKAVRELNGN